MRVMDVLEHQMLQGPEEFQFKVSLHPLHNTEVATAVVATAVVDTAVVDTAEEAVTAEVVDTAEAVVDMVGVIEEDQEVVMGTTGIELHLFRHFTNLTNYYR
jgi:23S rRNA G2445 N2-methylase RlmL